MTLTSSRVASPVGRTETGSSVTGALGLGYPFGNGWRVEGEYMFKRNNKLKAKLSSNEVFIGLSGRF
ncbi:hypothetical protein LGM43_04035 [Burkholderia seminalis]|uniref:hypothetical protein n=1 Tax=Burkholderia seminalis TaxID=488731 RepID=UPI001CF472BE|nr:hypothetical protein [Burkholderia seminalis]MCA7949432.1 hypothetical protein [Burkholderia seminalis]MDN7586080.1 hypothetical protein [Burkholderia seminalis]